MKGETITLAFFEMAIRLSGELRSVLSRSRLMPGSSPSLATAFHTTERCVTQGCSKDARDDYARLPSSSRAREECIGNGIALGAVTHVWHTTRANYYAPEREERDRSYRRYNTFVSRGDTPQQGSIRCERAASTDRALRREHMAARVDSHHSRRPSLSSAETPRAATNEFTTNYAKCNYRQIPKLQTDHKPVIIKPLM